MTSVQDWKWFGHAGHLIVAQWCRFHLCTLVGNYMVSTVGEYWPDRKVREIHASVHDAKWLDDNNHRKGDDFDRAYMERFGFEDIGYERTYETMVFRADKVCVAKDCNCGMPLPSDWSELDAHGYKEAGAATKGHYEMCNKWAQVEP